MVCALVELDAYFPGLGEPGNTGVSFEAYTSLYMDEFM